MKPMLALLAVFTLATAPGQEPVPTPRDSADIPQRSKDQTVVIPSGTRIPLVMVNSVSSRHAQPGDAVYLQCAYPVVVDGRVVIPAGTNVSGAVRRASRPGRVKGRGTLTIEAQQMILPNGVIRDLTGRPSALDGRSPENLDRESGTVKSPGTKGEDTEDIAKTTAAGATIGVIAGSAARRPGTGLGAGSIAGAGIGLATVLLTRGPDAVLARGTHVEMLLERDVRFTEAELAMDRQGLGSQPAVGTEPSVERNRPPRRRLGRRNFPL